MRKDELQQQQPLFYHALENACMNHRVANAYLLSGPHGTLKHEAALLFAKSIFCEEHHGIACEECNTCRRVEEGLYADMVLLDGSKNAISKDDVDAIQEKFSKTALENGNGSRVYILENVENASISAQNSMLKFLEEPASGVVAILTTDNIDRILPTIVSRCTLIPFSPLSEDYLLSKAKEVGVQDVDAYFISHLVKDINQMKEFADSSIFETCKMMFRQYFNLEGSREELLVDYDISYRSSEKDSVKAKKENILLLNGFFDLMSLFAHDVICKHVEGPHWYKELLQQEINKQKEYGELIIILQEQKDKINRFIDLNLLMDQTFYRLEEFNHEHGM